MLLRSEFHGTPPAKLEVESVSKWFRTARASVHALDNVSLTVAEGEFVCLVGPSGCGKSALLDIIAGLTKADEGRVLADNQPVEGPGRHRLVLFQEPALFPWLTVFGNVCSDELGSDFREAITVFTWVPGDGWYQGER